MSLSDAELVDEARAGSRAAFAALMERYERLVYWVCYSYTRGRDDALDVVQEVFVKAFFKLGSFRGEGSFRSWLLRVAHHESSNWHRRRRRRIQTEPFTPDLEPLSPPNQEDSVERHQTRTLLEAALGCLNPQQRLAVTLRYFDQRHLREIATVLECSEGNVKSLLFRSLRKLRGQLAPERS